MTAKDPSYAHTRFHSADSPPSAPHGKDDDPNPTSGAKRDAGFPDGRVADLGRMSSEGADGPSMTLRVKNLVKGMYHKSGGPREPS